jgi:methyl coenzyme M reductase beta subunit
MAIVSVGLIAVLGSRAEARSPSESSLSKIVTGEVAQVEGEFHMAKDTQGELTLDIVDKSYVITSQAGEEVRLELDDNTKVLKKVSPGDKIVAKISSKGHTLSVTRLEP